MWQVAAGEEKYAMGPQELAELGSKVEVPRSYEAFVDCFKKSTYNAHIHSALAAPQFDHQWMAAEVSKSLVMKVSTGRVLPLILCGVFVPTENKVQEYSHHHFPSADEAGDDIHHQE